VVLCNMLAAKRAYSLISKAVKYGIGYPGCVSWTVFSNHGHQQKQSVLKKSGVNVCSVTCYFLS
jgi:hypothetical protein